MRFVGLALISALAASGATWGCQNAQPLSSGAGEAPSIPTSTADKSSPSSLSPSSLSPESVPPEGVTPGTEAARAAIPAAPALSRVTRIALQRNPPNGTEPNADDFKSSDGLLAAGDQRLTDESLGDERLLQDPLIGDTLIGDGEPMDDVDDAASGVAGPDPDQAGAPDEPPSFPRPASP